MHVQWKHVARCWRLKWRWRIGRKNRRPDSPVEPQSKRRRLSLSLYKKSGGSRFGKPVDNNKVLEDAKGVVPDNTKKISLEHYMDVHLISEF